MDEEKEEEFGTIIVDGKIINLDKASEEELKKIEDKLKKEEEEIREKVDKILNEGL